MKIYGRDARTGFVSGWMWNKVIVPRVTSRKVCRNGVKRNNMVFSSLEFIFVFLPLCLLFYLPASGRWKNRVLFLASIIFYAVGTIHHPIYLVLPLSAVLVTYGAARGMQRYPHRKRWFLVPALIFLFGSLFVFKYFNFVYSNISTLFDLKQITTGLMLPAGISFYTFQATSYLVDVSRGVCAPSANLLDHGTYLMMFPYVISGPICRYPRIQHQLEKRHITLEAISSGLQLFIFGLGCKVLLANRIGGLWKQVCSIGFESVSTPLAWMGILAYSLQLYFDFYGYSLMAMGIGRMLGFSLPRNFDLPYMSCSMTEFWRRWHMTLGQWFRDYIYIPLGGSRCSKWKTMRNLLVVWLFTGIWHGAGWNFLLWGAILFVLIALEKIGWGKVLARSRVLGHIYMLICIPLTWAVFAITEIDKLWVFFTRLFPFDGQWASPVFSGDFLKYGREYGILLLIGCICCTGVAERFVERFRRSWFGMLVLLAVFWGSIWMIYHGLNDPFMYFQF